MRKVGHAAVPGEVSGDAAEGEMELYGEPEPQQRSAGTSTIVTRKITNTSGGTSITNLGAGLGTVSLKSDNPVGSPPTAWRVEAEVVSGTVTG